MGNVTDEDHVRTFGQKDFFSKKHAATVGARCVALTGLLLSRLVDYQGGTVARFWRQLLLACRCQRRHAAQLILLLVLFGRSDAREEN